MNNISTHYRVPNLKFHSLYNSMWWLSELVCVCVTYLSLESVQDGATALFVAAQNNHLRVVKLFIVAKAHVDIQRKVK